MRPCSSHRLHWSVVALHGPPTSIIRGSDICFVQLSALDRCNWERLPCHRYTLPKYFYNNRDRVSRDLTKELYFLFFQLLYTTNLRFFSSSFSYENLYSSWYSIFSNSCLEQSEIKVKDRFQRGNYELSRGRGEDFFAIREFYRFITQWTVYSTFHPRYAANIEAYTDKSFAVKWSQIFLSSATWLRHDLRTFSGQRNPIDKWTICLVVVDNTTSSFFYSRYDNR